VLINAVLLLLGFFILMGVFIAINHRRPRTAPARSVTDS
jgi:hypothetical protein